MQRLKFWAGLFGGLLILALAVASMASAHGGDAAKIHSCVNNNSGTIKIVLPSQGCSNNETPLDWSQGGATPADLAALQAQIGSVQQAMSAQINAVQQQLSAQTNAVQQQLSAQISSLQQEVNSQGAQINSLQQQVNSQGSQINSLQQAVNSHSTSINQLLAYDAALKAVLQQWRNVINPTVGNALQNVP
jgi:septal ring factor EnvC (AmiA/AmiB activator)